MFGFAPKDDPRLEDTINVVYAEMQEHGPTEPLYPELLSYLERLNQLKRTPSRVSPDQMVIVAGNILGILIIVAYEHAHVVTSKSLGFLLKPK